MLKQITQEVLSEYQHQEPDTVGFVDPFTMMLMMTLIIEVIKMIQECQEAKEVVQTVQGPTPLERLMVRRVIRKNTTRKQYRARRKELEAAIFKVGKTMTVNELQDLFQEVNERDVE